MKKVTAVYLLGREDASALVELECSCFSTSWTVDEYQKILGARCLVSDNRSIIAAAKRSLIVLGIMDDTTLIGYCSARIITSEAEIYNIAVVKSKRGQEMASLLLQTVKKIFSALDVERILLEVREGNLPALALYAQHGFIYDGCRSNYYPDGEDAILMSCSLQE